MAKKEFTEEQMREFCKETIPVLNQLKSIADKHGVEDSLRVYVSTDGYVSLEGSGLGGWELHRYSGEYEMKFEKRAAVFEKEEKDG